MSILGISLLSEAMNRLRMNQFLLSTNLHFDYLFHNREFQCAVTNDNLNNNIVVSATESVHKSGSEGQLVEFLRQESQKSKVFEDWSVCLNSIVPVLCGLTHSFRENN